MPEQGYSNSRRIWTSDQWRITINDWQLSGLTIASYCRQQGITGSVFRRWRRKLGLEAEGSSVNGFIPVHVDVEAENSKPSDFEVILSNGHRLCIGGGVDWGSLKDFLKQVLQ